MKILLIGSGAREHALAKALKKGELYNIGSQVNPGIAVLAKDVEILPFSDANQIIEYAKNKEIDLVVIGPEKPLEVGLADALWQAGFPVIGPTQKLAQIETSKGFARDLMQKYKIAGLPRYQRFPHFNAEAQNFLEELKDQYVVKADGLMSGKGVKVAGDHLHSLDEAVGFCKEISGPFVIEEKLAGPEFSLLSFSDGKTLAHMPAVQDHKRLLENDKGPNTGGMGTYTMANGRLPFLTEEDIRQAQAINESVVKALKQETGEGYRGVLYGGFMKTASGIKVIEYNARFGDPEAMNLLGLLETDFLEICAAIITGELDQIKVKFRAEASVCKYLVPLGYPDTAQKGGVLDISKIQNKEPLYYASIEEQNGKLTMLGSRALAVLSMNKEITKSEAETEKLISTIGGEFHHRSDIGKV